MRDWSVKGIILSASVILSGCMQTQIPISSGPRPAYYAETYDETPYEEIVPGMPYEETVVGQTQTETTIVQQQPILVEKLEAPKTRKAPTDEGEIVVKPKDTVYSLSREYKVPIRALINMNGLQPPYTLAIGQKLKLPSSPYYTVQKGDTIYSISRRFNVDMSSLAKTNGLEEPYIISPDQKLLLPGSVVREDKIVNVVEKKTEPKKQVAKTASAKKQPAKKTAAAAKTPTQKQAVVRRKTPAGSPPSFGWPVSGKLLSGYGASGKGRHNDGIDISAQQGTPVRASAGGTVVYTGEELEGFGKLILIKHQNGWVSAYAHLDEFLVNKNQQVAKGTPIGRVGKTGNVQTAQLHFEIRQGAKAVNPLNHLKR